MGTICPTCKGKGRVGTGIYDYDGRPEMEDCPDCYGPVEEAFRKVEEAQKNYDKGMKLINKLESES